MSIVAIQGGATGTGTVTVVAPSTSINRTLTLPDVTATVITDSAGVLNIGSGQVYKDASGNVGIGTSSPARKLEVSDASDGQIRITGTAAANGGHMLVYNNDGQIASFGINGSTSGRYSGTGANVAVLGTLTNCAFAFGTNNTERARIDSSGNLLVGDSTGGARNTNSVNFNPAPGYGFNSHWNHINGTSSGVPYLTFNYNGGICGSIAQSGTTAVAYNTTSDYRLKENVAPLTGALARVAALKPVTYTWKAAPDETGEGFIAHELAEVCPQATTGEKDAVDAEGNPQYQGIDTSFLVATLTAAIQELKALVDTQAARITALEAM